MQENLQPAIDAKKRIWMYTGYAALAVILALVVSLSVMESYKSRAEEQSDRVLLALAQEMQSELVFTLRTYDGIHKNGADFDGAILPSVKQHLNTAMAINNILVSGYGSEYSVLDTGIYNRVEQFYSEYAFAKKTSRSTDEAMALLDKCMRELETVVLTRFEANGAIILE